MTNYFEKVSWDTVILHGFKHLHDSAFLYVSPIDGKIAIEAKMRSKLKRFDIKDGRIVSDAFVRHLDVNDAIEKEFLYNPIMKSYYPI